ncbi:photosynthetic complex assembly protein PuhC [Rubrimonas cliftonensis]|uniref:Putative photosynthetic complex assembly protein n=1 Tax=Rubrimonas cliftonensis TaxID=89524 RepID=A0A1H4ACV9_9RHOB|nr:photosynthetic complex assembly protein PuhC [Rubrimonas cliftonensis]SEA33933.1 putative photosynthetic complex assembly protein [Rubrimonas cliftonensis]
MSDHAERRHAEDHHIPRGLVLAAAALALFTMVAVVYGRATDTGLMLAPQAEAVETRSLYFTDSADGAMVVTDAVSGQMVALLSEGQDGFIRGVLRGLTRGRAVTREGGDDVLALTRWDDGRLSISDPATGERFFLNSFGADNLQAFARLLASREDIQ